MKRSYLTVAVWLLALALAPAPHPVMATAATTPARLGDHDTSLVKRIRFPDVSGNFTLYVRCEAKVAPGGNINEIGCYDEERKDAAFYRAVHLAANNATVIPARVDGEPTNVLMLFSVIFRQQGTQRTIAVLPNHGTNAKTFGLDYIAPQKYGYTIQYYPRAELGLLWLDGNMDAQGELSAVNYLKTEWDTAETRRYARKYVEQARFIPGHVNGQPQSMRFVKPIFGYKNGFMWDKGDTFCRDSIINCDEKSNRTGRTRYVFDD